MSISACREVICCSTVLPAPNGPGMQYVPPRTTGNIESMMRTRVTSGSVGISRRRATLSGTFTGQFCCIVTSCSTPFASLEHGDHLRRPV
jgi:hypothetical protein